MATSTSQPQQSTPGGVPPQPSLSQQSTLAGSTTPPRPANTDFFDRELKRFRARLTGTRLQEFRATDHAALLSELGRIQKMQEDSGLLRNLGRIRSFLEAMDQFGKVIEIFLNAADMVAFVWGPIKFLLLTASTFTDSFELLIDAYEQIGEQLPMLMEYRELFFSDPKLVDALKAMYTDILEFHQRAISFFTEKRWTKFLKSMWKDYHTKFNGILANLKRHKSLIESRASLAHFRMYQKDTNEMRATNLDQFRIYQDDIQALNTTTQSQYQRHQDNLDEMRATNLTQFQIYQDDVQEMRTTHLDQYQRHQDELHAIRTTSLNYYQRNQDDIQSLKSANLDQYRRYQDDIREMKAKLDELLAAEQLKKLLTVREWLAARTQVQPDHDAYTKIRNAYSTTTHWILKHEAVAHWMGAAIPNTPILWLNGIPGAGKTILASAVIDGCKRDPNFMTGFFYCHEGDHTSNSAVGILKGIIDQLLVQHPHMLPVCYTRRMNSNEPILGSLPQAHKMLEELCSSIPKVYIFIDGLDECEQSERKQVLQVLVEIASRCDEDDPGKLRILLISQDYADIRRMLLTSSRSRMVAKVISVTNANNEVDIKAFTNTWVDKIASRFSPLPDDTLEYLRNLTVANAKGMFLYAKLVLEHLYGLASQAEMLEAMKQVNFPEDLKAAYDRILTRIKLTSTKQQWLKARKLLGWMVCAKRRLTWKEIQVAISIDTEHQTIEYDSRRVRDHIYETCGSLVILNSDQVSLVHSTAKRYIMTVGSDADGTIHESSVECELATLCLQYLIFPCFEIDPSPDPNELRQSILEGNLAFEDYAVANWFHHLTAWANSGEKFLNEVPNRDQLLADITDAMDDFMTQYQEEQWDQGIIDVCKVRCGVFSSHNLYDNLVALMSHIYAFQTKGFDARHTISITSLSLALDRNRKMLEQLPSKLNDFEKVTYRKFYDDERLYKCSRITCRYFSEGFRDQKARKRHVDIHNRPYQCEVLDCLGTEGFASQKDLDKHTRGYHPERSDLAETFRSATAKRANASHACTMCGKTFTRNFHRKNHEASHRGEKPHECAECGRAFTRLNDLKRHQKLHDRK
ncbi:hypothetical protein NX059_002183 [Plenodomus lindquistii]|nr:hypothetical protein NX059_002183 [Plenodomus lindquistii]